MRGWEMEGRGRRLGEVRSGGGVEVGCAILYFLSFVPFFWLAAGSWLLGVNWIAVSEMGFLYLSTLA